MTQSDIADTPRQDADSAQATVPGWKELIDTLSDLPGRLLARLPEEMRNDPQVQQEVGRLALSALAGSALDTLAPDGNHPWFLPQLNVLTFGGQPNPDTIYRFTKIAPGGTYRLRGTKGNIRIAKIGEMTPYIKNGDQIIPTPINAYHDINELKVDNQGRFDVILSPERPDGYEGDWWPLQPEANKLLLRFVRGNWYEETEPTISIERLDIPADRPRPSAEAMEQKLRDLPAEVGFMSGLFVDKPEKLRAEGYVNKFKVFDVSGMGGLAGQFYYEGPYELKDDEALVIEAETPSEYKYWSIMVTNETYDTLDWYNNHTCLNDSQAKVDPDGVLRLVLSTQDPGVPNWLSTAGHRRGLVQGRWMECDTPSLPKAKVVPLSEVRSHLHADTGAVTPEERDQIIRERRTALQQRALW